MGDLRIGERGSHRKNNLFLIHLQIVMIVYSSACMPNNIEIDIVCSIIYHRSVTKVRDNLEICESTPDLSVSFFISDVKNIFYHNEKILLFRPRHVHKNCSKKKQIRDSAPKPTRACP